MKKKKKTEMDSNGLLSYKSNKPGSKKKKKTGFVYQKLYIRSDAHRLLLLTDKGKWYTHEFRWSFFKLIKCENWVDLQK